MISKLDDNVLLGEGFYHEVKKTKSKEIVSH